VRPLRDLLAGLADREARRSEATIQADIRALLLGAPFQLSEGDLKDVPLESPAGEGRRIDVETGTTVFEVKRDLRRPGVLRDAINQLKGYVETRQAQMERRYVGVLTDGAEWRCYHLTAGGMTEAASIVIRKEKPDVEALLMWLEGVLATAQQIPPVPSEIAARLGAGSSAHALDQASLRDLYSRHRDQPDVKIKRQLWARLLTTALGSQFEDSDDLFVEHTLLVNTAEIIAHAVLGLDVATIPPPSLLSGAKFSEHGIHGVVEPDFFDWVSEVPSGALFIRTLARRLGRFDWSSVRHDILKILYESVITRETRKKLGEYYTPDWLAERMVEATVQHPLTERVLDPACGSGTFLFHAIRRYLAAAEATGLGVEEALNGVSSHIIGMDLHPVAVTLARVTYVLAIGSERLADRSRGAIQVPVYLGDSIQWQQKNLELWTAGFLVIQADGEPSLFSLELRFPESLLEDARRFDELVEDLAKKATNRPPGSPVPSLNAVFQRLAIPEALQATLERTFHALCSLHDLGRDHIWGYYVRNLARPIWLAQASNRVDVLIGNPPWLAYRHMPREMQEKFREMSDLRGLWHGAKMATNQDLSGLFVARAVELYLVTGGRFAFVMPNAALDRAQFAGLRAGEYSHSTEIVRVGFDTPWDLRRLRPHFFPRGSAVVFGQRNLDRVEPMPPIAEVFQGRLDQASGDDPGKNLERHLAHTAISDQVTRSPYKRRFRQGATVVPRVLFTVEEMPAGPLGLRSGTMAVRSARTANEKRPWKDLPSLEGVVESEFVFPLYLGEHVLPYRVLPGASAVLPWNGRGLLNGTDSRLELYPGLARWWQKAEEVWRMNRSSERLSLLEQLDYHAKLTAQFPLQPLRIVYTASGMHLSAACIGSRRHVVEHALYWATARSRDEALYLCAILNTAEITRQVRPLMSYGKDERHIDKHIWRLPIPEFNPMNAVHSQLARLGTEVEAEVAGLELKESGGFVGLRRQVRRLLQESVKAQRIEDLVVKLMS